jgi:hypothetical protein
LIAYDDAGDHGLTGKWRVTGKRRRLRSALECDEATLATLSERLGRSPESTIERIEFGVAIERKPDLICTAV